MSREARRLERGREDANRKTKKQIREQVQSGAVEVSWIPTQQQLADVLTKPLRGRSFIRLRDAIVVPVPVRMEVKASSLVGECRDASE